jgi:hypothetical protein
MRADLAGENFFCYQGQRQPPWQLPQLRGSLSSAVFQLAGMCAVGHPELGECVPNGAGRHRVRRRRRAAVGQPRHLPAAPWPPAARTQGSRPAPNPAARPRPTASWAGTAESRSHRGHCRIDKPRRRRGRGGAGYRRAGQRGGVTVELGPKLVDHGDRCASASSSSATPGEARLASSAEARASKRVTIARNRSLARATASAAVPAVVPR